MKLSLAIALACVCQAQSLNIIDGPVLSGTGTITGAAVTYKNHPDPSAVRLGSVLILLDGEHITMVDATTHAVITSGGINNTGGYPISSITFWQNFAGTFTGTCFNQSCNSEPQCRWLPTHTLGILNADGVTDPEDRIICTNALGGTTTSNSGPWLVMSADTTHATDLSTWKAKHLASSVYWDYDAAPTINFKKNIGLGVGWLSAAGGTSWGISLFTWPNLLFTSGNIGSFQDYVVNSGAVYPEFYGGTTSYGTDSNDLYLVRQTWTETADGTTMTYRILDIPPPSGSTFSPSLISNTLTSTNTYYMASGSNIAQKGSATTIRTRDGYHIWDVIQNATDLFFAHSTMQSTGGAGLTGTQWYRVALSSVQSGSPTVADTGSTISSGHNFMYGQAGVDSNGTLFLTGFESDSTTYGQLVVYWRLSTDTAATLRGPTVLQAGTGATTCKFQSPWSAVGLYHQSFPLATDMTQMLVSGSAVTNTGDCAWTWYTVTIQATLGTGGGSASGGNAAFGGNMATR